MSMSQPRTKWKPASTSTPPPAEAWAAQGADVLPRRRWYWAWLRVLTGLLLFSAFLALLVYFAFWLSPARGTAVVLLATGYEENLAVPHNVYGRHGLDAVAQFLAVRGSAAGLRLHQKTTTLNNLDEWDKGLRNFDEKNLLLFVSLHGGADRQGGYLLPDRAQTPIEPDSLEPDVARLRLEAMLDRLTEVPPNRNIVLVLDATQVGSSWHLGLVQNTFAAELDKLNERILSLPNLVVLSASDVGQKSWVSEELGRTVFSHYALLGLQGEADANADSRVDALELHQFVAQNTERWCAVNRGALQTPVLYPKGADGEARAQKIRLALITGPSAPVSARVLEGSEALDKAWKKCQDLEKQVPHPAVYAPGPWRFYRDLLLRYEQLIIAGESEISAGLALKLDALAQKIGQDRAYPLPFGLQNSLALAGAMGYALPDGVEASKQFAKLWDAKDTKEREEVLQQIRKDFNPFSDALTENLLRLRLLELLLVRTADDPAPALEKSAVLAKLLDAADDPRPAEAHYLVMLQHSLKQLQVLTAGDAPKDKKDTPKPLLTPADLQLTLQVRLQAERAALGLPGYKGALKGHAYSELLLPWLKAPFEKADEQRRYGQDLLFASDLNLLQDARKNHNLARKGYEDLLAAKGDGKSIALLQNALALRDQVVPKLPYLAKWVAGRPPAGLEKEQEYQALLSKTRELCTSAHELIKLIEAEPVTVAKTGTNATAAHWLKVEQTTKKVQQAFAYVDGKLETILKQAELVADPTQWREIDNLLTVPIAAPAVRKELLTKRSKIADQLLQKLAAQPHSWPRITARENTTLARQQSITQAQLALAVLGERYFDEVNDGKQAPWELAQAYVKQLEQDNPDSMTLPKLGDAIGWRWQQFPQAVARAFKKDYKATPDQVLASAQTADRYARWINGAGQAFLTKPLAPDYRDLRMQQLLLWQAQRTYQDHWYGEQPGKIYFQEAGEAYLKDAEKSFADPALAALREELQRAGALQLKLYSAPGVPAEGTIAKTLHLTTERDFPLKYRLQPVNELAAPPSGFPVVWMKPGPLLQPTIPGEVQRQMAFFSAKTATLIGASFVNPLASEKKAGDPKVVETYFTANALFRGQQIEQTTTIQFHPLAQIVKVVHPLPKASSVTVRSTKAIQETYGSSAGHIAIVLDCSGSMGPPKGKTDLNDTKFAAAVQTLVGVMKSIPKGTTVSLWTFGQAVGSEKTVKDAEKSIRRLLPPVKWNPQDPIQADYLVKELSAVQPWNESPIVRTMFHARDDLINSVGFKSLIVITDGMDNRIANDPEFNPAKKDIPSLLLENFKDIKLYIVGFQVESGELAQAKEQFASVDKLGIGKFYDIRDKVTLEFTLKNVLRQQLHYWIDRLDDVSVVGFPEQGLDVSLTGVHEKWVPGGLDPGNYKVRVHTNKILTKPVALNPSDLLMIELGTVKKLGGPGDLLDFRRILFAEEEHPGKVLKQEGNWLLALLQNEKTKDGGAQMLVTLEKKSDIEDELLQQLRPRDTWLEVGVAKLDAPGTKTVSTDDVFQRWHYQSGYPAPAWSIDVAKWPKTQLPGGTVTTGTSLAKPVVRAWFHPQQPAKGLLLERGHAFASPFAVENKRITLSGQEFILDSIALEDHPVEVKAPRPDQQAKVAVQKCLVVRITHAAGSPVWVRLHGLPHGGEEHHFFTKANKYTGIFWPVTADQANQVLQSIEVISLADFKKSAQDFNYAITLDSTYEPRSDSKRPQSPVDLFALTDGESAAPGTDIPPAPKDATPPAPDTPSPPAPGPAAPGPAVPNSEKPAPPPLPELPAPKNFSAVTKPTPPKSSPATILVPSEPVSLPVPQLPYQQPVFPYQGPARKAVFPINGSTSAKPPHSAGTYLPPQSSLPGMKAQHPVPQSNPVLFPGGNTFPYLMPKGD